MLVYHAYKIFNLAHRMIHVDVILLRFGDLAVMHLIVSVVVVVGLAKCITQQQKLVKVYVPQVKYVAGGNVLKVHVKENVLGMELAVMNGT